MRNVNFESKLSDAIARFSGVLNSEENTQQKVHEIIMCLKEDAVLNNEETVLTQNVLNAFLSLSFILKNNEEDLDEYINYYI